MNYLLGLSWAGYSLFALATVNGPLGVAGDALTARTVESIYACGGTSFEISSEETGETR